MQEKLECIKEFIQNDVNNIQTMAKEIVQTSQRNISKQLQCDRFVTFV